MSESAAAQSKLNIRYWVVKLRKAIRSLSESFWFTPLVMIIASIVSAYLLPTISSTSIDSFFSSSRLAVSDKDAAMQIVQGIASAVITITSIAFSMTIVALVMASNQFGPRLLKNFMQNKMTQFALGIFTSTFVFCLMVQSQIKTESSTVTVVHPQLSVFISIILALICVMVLIVFIHHVATSIRADTVVKNTAYSLMLDMQKLKAQSERVGMFPNLLSQSQLKSEAHITSDCDGYIQAIEYQYVTDLAMKYDGLIVMEARAGDYIVQGAKVASLHSNAPLPKKISIDEALVVGEERTSLQDPLFGINQLVEMAIRALSPSLDDPFTACNCIDRLASALNTFSPHDLPQPLITVNNKPAVLTSDPDYRELFDGAFTQIRQSCYAHPFVLSHLLDTFAMMAQANNNAKHVQHAIKPHFTSIQEHVSDGKAGFSSQDQRSYESRENKLEERLK